MAVHVPPLRVAGWVARPIEQIVRGVVAGITGRGGGL